jgi:hypothetical protein
VTDKRSCRDCIHCRMRPITSTIRRYKGFPHRPYRTWKTQRRVYCSEGHWDGRELHPNFDVLNRDGGPVLMQRMVTGCPDYDDDGLGVFEQNTGPNTPDNPYSV